MKEVREYLLGGSGNHGLPLIILDTARRPGIAAVI